MDIARAEKILAQSDILVSADQCSTATTRMARDIGAAIGSEGPLVLAVMGGATVFAGHLLSQLTFPLEFDYIHVSRYGDKTRGGSLTWKVEPSKQVEGRTVLVLDDILDEGETMAEIRRRVLAMGAKRFLCAVFAKRRSPRRNRSSPISSASPCRTAMCSATAWTSPACGAICRRCTLWQACEGLIPCSRFSAAAG